MDTLLKGPLEFVKDMISKPLNNPLPPEETKPEPITPGDKPPTETPKPVPVRTIDGNYKDIPLDVLLRLLALSKTEEYESLARDKYKSIEEFHKKLKILDVILNKITNELNDKKSIDMTKSEIQKSLQEIKKLGIAVPETKKMSFDQASSFIRTLENFRDEVDRDIKLAHGKFQESVKDLESIRQVILQMISTLRESLVKITSGIRSA